MKDLNEIMIFARVAQLGSFSKAAQTLQIPVSTVSRKVSDLEARLGLTLIQRTTRKLNLTRSGTQYFEMCADLLAGLDEAETQVTQLQTQPEGTLRVSIPVGMGSGRFMEFVSRFLKQYPKIDIDLVITNQYIDLVDEGVDVAIRFGALESSSLIGKYLGHSSRYLVASAEYLKKNGIPKQPSDLKNHQCVVYRSRSPETSWELVKERSRQRVMVGGRVMASDMIAIKELAIHGHGLALLPEMYCVDEIQKGVLRHVLPDWKYPNSPVHAVYASRRFLPARLDFFLKELEGWKSPNWER